MLGAEPYPSVNVGSGTVTEALNWLHYCNGTEDTGYGGLRRSHGQAEPYGVKWWGIGNENWGCGGLFSSQEFAQQFQQYAVYFKRLGLTQDLQLVAAGHNAPGWNLKFLQAVGPGLPYLDHVSFHRYFRRGHSTDFTDDEYLELMLDVGDFEKLIQESIHAIDQVESFRAKMRVFGPLKPKPIGSSSTNGELGTAIRSSRTVSHSAASYVKQSLQRAASTCFTNTPSASR